MFTKICGITNSTDALWAASQGADFVGMVCAASPRRVTVEAAAQIARQLPDQTPAVLVFRDAPVPEVVKFVNDCGADWLQLHGKESIETVIQIRTYLPAVRIVRAWEVGISTAADELRAYLDQAAAAGIQFDWVLLDAPKGGVHPGFEQMAMMSRAVADLGVPIWLGGGLTAAELGRAVAGGGYAGVDVATGVESRPGIKDPEAVQRFVQTARALQPVG